VLLATSGDAIDIAFPQLESGTTPTSYYPGTRPLGYIDNWQSYTLDTGNVLCCPEPAVTLRGWTAAQAASAYSYGGGAFARVWFPQTSAYGLRVDIVDSNNLQGYLEAVRMVAAPYWATGYNPNEVKFTPSDTTIVSRLDSGDQWADFGKFYGKLQLTLSAMAPADRPTFVSMLRNNKGYPILISVFPQNGDTTLERDCMFYGRRVDDSDITLQAALVYNSSLKLESI
jgi:hypothetical protein